MAVSSGETPHFTGKISVKYDRQQEQDIGMKDFDGTGRQPKVLLKT